MPYFVYILRTNRNTLYTGITNNLDKRLKEHQNKKSRGAKYTRAFASLKLVHTEEFETKSEALRREIEIKKLTKQQKETLVKQIK